MEEDLSGVKAGDLIALYYCDNPPELRAVKKITPTQIVLASFGDGSDWRFRRDTGYEIGGRSNQWRRTYIALVTDAIKAEIARNAALESLKAALESLKARRWDNVPTETLFAVCELLKQLSGVEG